MVIPELRNLSRGCLVWPLRSFYLYKINICIEKSWENYFAPFRCAYRLPLAVCVN